MKTFKTLALKAAASALDFAEDHFNAVAAFAVLSTTWGICVMIEMGAI